jgi:YbgC/YbaW family acyl-CoA thioester hydrolase
MTPTNHQNKIQTKIQSNPEKIHHYPLKILESHLDSFGHVNNATYLSLFEEARWDLVTNNGYSLKRIQEIGQGPVILRVTLEFIKELRLRQQIYIETRLLSYQKKLGVIYQEIKNEQNQVCTKAEFTMGLFDLKQRKLIAPTDEWLQAINFRQPDSL